MDDLTTINNIIDSISGRYTALSDAAWDEPELRWQEFTAAENQIAVAEEEGFTITRNVAAIPTAFMAQKGHGGPILAVLGEYDGLAELSQASGVAERLSDPTNTSGNGQGCGHHLLGAGSLLAASAIARYLDEKGVAGTVRYYGCPAEEAAAGKSFMVKAGAFKEVDAALTWHPNNAMTSTQWLSLAYCQAYFRFRGTAAHAGVSPELGRSALDALELLNVGVNFLREHMTDSSRIHYAIVDGGGNSPNVVQPKAAAYYVIRARTVSAMRELYERVCQIAEGAALMTGTQVSVEFDGGSSEILPNDVLEAALHRNVKRLGGVPFDHSDQEAARKFTLTIPKHDLSAARKKLGLETSDSSSLYVGVPPEPTRETRPLVHGSTDVGDVSWVTPTVQLSGSNWAIGTPIHSWQTVAQGKLPAAHKGMIYAAKAIAATAIDLYTDPDLMKSARHEFETTISETPYDCPIPDDVVAPPARAAKMTDGAVS
ncbi:amidohydrolase [Rhodococcus jostii]|uniref:amidohydrolase n=1 Tax=Rhodococcus jostii TaxID=132919 RepID=UPI00363F30C6